MNTSAPRAQTAEERVVNLPDLIARLAHAGQTDKAGMPYIEHPRRVAQIVRDMGYGHPYTTVALLHDTVEDTDVSLDDLRGIYNPLIVQAIDNLTRRLDESPEQYYARVRSHKVSLVVKHADIMDNTDPTRTAKLDPETRARLTKKYAKAINQLGGPLTPETSG